MSSKSITRVALGREAKIGALYDIRTESFLNDTRFASKLHGDMIDLMNLEKKVIELVQSESLQERYNKLDVEADLQVSVMSGMVKLNGSGVYLADKKSERAQSMSLIYKIRSVNEEILVRQNKKNIDVGILTEQARHATHVVVAIDWGANCCITCKYNNIENKDDSMVEEALMTEMRKIEGLIEEKGSGNSSVKETDNELHGQFTFKYHADISDSGQNLLSTSEGAARLAKALPSLVKSTNDAKGVPLTYYLMPLETIVKMCKPEVELDIQYKGMSGNIVKECTDVLERISNNLQIASDTHHDMHGNDEFIPDKLLNEIDGVLNKLSVMDDQFKLKLRVLLVEIRSGKVDVSVLPQMLSEHESDVVSVLQYKDGLNRFQKHLHKIKLIKQWIGNGVIYIGKGERLSNQKSQSVVFYKIYNDSYKGELEKMEGFFTRMQSIHSNDADIEFIVLDHELSPQLWPTNIKKATVQKFTDGKLTCVDLYVEEGPYLQMCLVKIKPTAYRKTSPQKRTCVKLSCPNRLSGIGKCSDDTCRWRCLDCKEVIEYGIDSHKFYCKCGGSEPVDALFRCNADSHTTFVGYPHRKLKDELSKHRAMGETNILILGETGVGKSTWINSFQNYLCFEDLNEAIESQDFHVLIPACITYTKDGEERKIQVGKSNKNEVLDTGKSCTKEPRSYVFYVGEQRVRLIDTPGIGDCDGIQQDKENLDNVLSFLTSYEDIHAVCILLKPNISRLTKSFTFCIQELLVQLHSSARDNILFCFTNARATLFKPGNTLATLNEMFSERNIDIKATALNYFFFDSEPFRCLALTKNGVIHSDEEMDTFAKSWERSANETKRLLTHVQELTPHDIKTTLNMNEAKRRVVAMSKPLAEVATVIIQSKQKVEDAKKEIRETADDINQLRKGLTFSGYDIIRQNLEYPRTVCSHADCVTFVRVGKDRVENKVYKQICHDKCYIPSFSSETINDFKLRLCHCMYIWSGKCSKCDHHYKCHMHLTYKTEIVSKTFLSEDVQEQILKKDSLQAQKKEAERVLDADINELKQEQKQIIETAAKCSLFLQENALLAYNDAVGDYLEMCIKQEQTKGNDSRNNTHLEEMELMKQDYENQIRILDEAMKSGTYTKIPTPAEVVRLQEELFRLKHFGPTLKRLFYDISMAHSARNKKFGETTAPVSPGYTDNRNTSTKRWYTFWKTH